LRIHVASVAVVILATACAVPLAGPSNVLAKPRSDFYQKVSYNSTKAIRTSAELMAALSSATAGMTILLAPGDYGTLKLNNPYGQPWAQFAGEVTIKSAEADHPAIFDSVQLYGVKNLTFDAVKFDYVSAAGASFEATPFFIKSSSDITIKNSVFDGDLLHGVSTTLDGLATGSGVLARQSTRITIEHNDFSKWYRAAAFGETSSLIVKDNNVHDISSDGFDFADVDNALIENNYIHDFKTGTGHPDMIQFWTAGTTSPSTNIVIRGNFLNSGAGSLTQSIFMRNELVDTGAAGQEMFYQNITIDNNVIYNASTHGITVGETTGLTIKNNTVLQNPASAADVNTVYVPAIHLEDGSHNVLIANNVLPFLAYYPQLTSGSTSERTVTGNVFVQNDRRAKTYIGDLFVDALAGAHATLADLSARPGGIIERLKVGSTMTQPGARPWGVLACKSKSPPNPCPAP
jgi:Right handed beta helix region